eukprot:GILI01021863.1.p1 GENE.GILI01021863.1~~GILI01021863.1.p1  ORF type:complete len:516 (-),score=32.11 GILI01021863.1:36-1529(-)
MADAKKVPADFDSWAKSLTAVPVSETLNLERADGLPGASSQFQLIGNDRTSIRNQLLSLSLPPFVILNPAGAHPDEMKNIPMNRLKDVPTSNAPQTHIEAHSAKCYQLATRMILSRRFSPSSKVDEQLIALMKGIGLTSSVDTSKGDSLITTFGLTFCMAAMGQQWWWLLWGAIASTLSNQGNQQEIWQIVKVLAAADSGLVYKVPNSDDHSLGKQTRQFINRLSFVGLCLPFKRGDKELFLISPFLRLAVNSSQGGDKSSFCAATLSATRGAGASTGKAMTIRSVKVARAGCKRGREDSSVSDCISVVSDILEGRIAEADSVKENEGGVVTETNFRLYVYSKVAGALDDPLASSTLLNIVSQFAEHDVTIPHRPSSDQQPKYETFSVFRLTRAAFARAHRRGISAQHIIEFLTLKAHSSAAVAVPTSVQDQLWMWQETCERAEWSSTDDPVVLLTFADQETLRRVVGLGVTTLHQNGLRVALSLSQFTSQCKVGMN